MYIVNTIFNSWYALVYDCQIMESLFLFLFFFFSFFVCLCVFLFLSYFHRSSHIKAHSLILYLSFSVCLTIILYFPLVQLSLSASHSIVHTQIVHTHSFLIGSALVSRESVVCAVSVLPFAFISSSATTKTRAFTWLRIVVWIDTHSPNIHNTHTHNAHIVSEWKHTTHIFFSPFWKNKNMRSDFSSYRAMFGVGSRYWIFRYYSK